MNFRNAYNKIINETNSLYHELCNKLNMTDSDLLILYVLYDAQNPLTQKDLSDFTSLPKQTVNSCVKKFEQLGILKLENLNGKSKHILITEEGRKFIDEKVKPITKLEDKIFSSWTETELQTFIQLSTKFKNQLENEVNTYEK